MAEIREDTKTLELEAVIGFNGRVRNGLLTHPDGVHLVYSLGSTVVIKDLRDNSQKFLEGHTDRVSCLALSGSGRLLASGQVTHMGFKADVIVWDLEAALEDPEVLCGEAALKHRMRLHKVKIQDLAFSPSEEYLATLGGQDDNNLVIWDVEDGSAICGSPAANDSAACVKWWNTRDDKLVTGGTLNLRLWDFDKPHRKLRPTDANLGQLKRVITSIALDDEDTRAYCGTASGDLLEVNLSNGRFVRASAERFALGIRTVACFRRGDRKHFIVGTGDGTIARLGSARLHVVKHTKLMGCVSSLSLNEDATHFFVGTQKSNVYYADVRELDAELRHTCHADGINDVCFPAGCSDLFVTASKMDIRVWNARSRQELLRIQVPNLECTCVAVMPDGRSIVSGWDDGKIRAFAPESGRLRYVISDAHHDGVTSIASTHVGDRLISGGRDGRVRVWRIGSATQTMEASWKEHSGAVNSIKVRADDSECVSAAADGSCIVWDMERYARNQALFASTVFKSILYHPDESQLLTCGSDRKITYWDSFDGNAIRILEASEDELNALDIEPDGVVFISGGEDRIVRVWNYDEGFPTAVGVGHSGGIAAVRISPDQQSIISVGSEGAIFVWKMPEAGAVDLIAKGYVPKASVEDEVDDVAEGLAKLRADRLDDM